MAGSCLLAYILVSMLYRMDEPAGFEALPFFFEGPHDYEDDVSMVSMDGNNAPTPGSSILNEEPDDELPVHQDQQREDVDQHPPYPYDDELQNIQK